MNNYLCTNSGCNPCQPHQPSKPPQHDDGCPCGEDFRRLLELLCGQQLRSLVDFSTFAFITDFFILGTSLSVPAAGTAPGDNLDNPSATYVCGGDSCETVTVSGQLYHPEIEATALNSTVTQAALCRLKAVAFEASAEDDGAASNFQSISQIFDQILRSRKPHECGSMIEALTNAAAVRAATVVTGPLVVENSAILGQLGDVLVMANSTDRRFYFICATQIDFIG